MEVWKLVRDFPGYSVSDYGRVRNDMTERIMSVYRTDRTRLSVGMVRFGKQYNRGLARLVSQHHVPQIEPHFDTPIHLDGDYANCYARNLVWRPRWFAQEFSKQFNAPHRPYSAIRDRRTDVIYDNVWDLVMERGLLLRQILGSANSDMHVFPTQDRFEWI